MKAIALFSGGLDSMLAIKILQEQRIEVLAYTFATPFFGPEAALAAQNQLGIQIRIQEITDIYMGMLKNPRYGYGKNMNPCIDCHGLMFRLAGEKMAAEGAHFLCSGEVLGERPFSQNRGALNAVANLSQHPDLIVRPLSAKLLPETLAEKSGWVDRSRLLDIQGRSRKRQMALADQFGILNYPKPAGGCRLTEPHFANRLKDLFKYNPDPSVRELELLKIGRHLRWQDGSKIIIGRRQEENTLIEAMAKTGDLIFWVKEVPGPTVIIPFPCSPSDDLIRFAAQVTIRYSDALPNEEMEVIYTDGHGQKQLQATACTEENIKKYMF